MKTINLLMWLWKRHSLSLLDPLVLLTIAHHPGAGKSDLVEILYGARDATKSTLDGPIKRLQDLGLINATKADKVNRKAGEALVCYSISEAGIELIRGIS